MCCKKNRTTTQAYDYGTDPVSHGYEVPTTMSCAPDPASRRHGCRGRHLSHHPRQSPPCHGGLAALFRKVVGRRTCRAPLVESGVGNRDGPALYDYHHRQQQQQQEEEEGHELEAEEMKAELEGEKNAEREDEDDYREAVLRRCESGRDRETSELPSYEVAMKSG